MADNVGPGKRWRSRAQFAKELGMISQEVYKLENGTTVQLKYLVKMHQVMGIDLNYLILGRHSFGDKHNSYVIKQLEKAIELLKG